MSTGFGYSRLNAARRSGTRMLSPRNPDPRLAEIEERYADADRDRQEIEQRLGERNGAWLERLRAKGL